MKTEAEVRDMLKAYATEINNGSRRTRDRYWIEALSWVLKQTDNTLKEGK